MFHDIDTEALKQLLSNVQTLAETEETMLRTLLEAALLREFEARGFEQNDLGVVVPVVGA